MLMNALEIEEYIMARSTGYVDGDVMELMLGPRRPSPQQQVIPRDSQLPQNYLNLDTFFPGERQQQQQEASDTVLTAQSISPMNQEPRVIRISQRRLIRNMTSLFVCTSDGPAFCTGSLERAIIASAIV